MDMDGRNTNSVGCGSLTLLLGAILEWAAVSNLGTGTRPIGTLAGLIMGGALILAGLYRIVVGMIRGNWRM